jgi:hypothetical protein
MEVVLQIKPIQLKNTSTVKDQAYDNSSLNLTKLLHSINDDKCMVPFDFDNYHFCRVMGLG